MPPAAFDRFRNPAKAAPTPAAPGTDTAPPPGGPRVALVARERRAQAILASLDNLPTLPAVATEVLHLAQSPTASARDFEEILRRDQALTARVLKLVNSPFFGLRRAVTSIPQAVVVLGMRTLRSVAVAAQTSRLLDRPLGPYGLAEGGMWMHSMSCASLTRVVARRARFGPDCVEELFVGGLLHDVGKVILAPYVAQAQADFDRAFAAGKDVVAAESEVLGVIHPDVGGAMARRWGLSAGLVELIEGHHRAFEPGYEPRLVVVQVANELCNQLGVGRRAGPAAAPPDHRLRLAALGLAGDADALREESRAAIAGLESAFRELARV